MNLPRQNGAIFGEHFGSFSLISLNMFLFRFVLLFPEVIGFRREIKKRERENIFEKK